MQIPEAANSSRRYFSELPQVYSAAVRARGGCETCTVVRARVVSEGARNTRTSNATNA